MQKVANKKFQYPKTPENAPAATPRRKAGYTSVAKYVSEKKSGADDNIDHAAECGACDEGAAACAYLCVCVCV